MGRNEPAEASFSDGRDSEAARLPRVESGWRTNESAGRKDPRYQFAEEGDKGRAEIMAFIQNRLDWIKSQMPNAFNKVVNPNMEVKRLAS